MLLPCPINKTHHVLFLKLIILILCTKKRAAQFYCSFILSKLCEQMLSIFSSQLISGLFARLCMQGLNKEDLDRHGDDKKKEMDGSSVRKRER